MVRVFGFHLWAGIYGNGPGIGTIQVQSLTFVTEKYILGNIMLATLLDAS